MNWWDALASPMGLQQWRKQKFGTSDYLASWWLLILLCSFLPVVFLLLVHLPISLSLSLFLCLSPYYPLSPHICLSVPPLSSTNLIHHLIQQVLITRCQSYFMAHTMPGSGKSMKASSTPSPGELAPSWGLWWARHFVLGLRPLSSSHFPLFSPLLSLLIGSESGAVGVETLSPCPHPVQWSQAR